MDYHAQDHEHGERVAAEKSKLALPAWIVVLLAASWVVSMLGYSMERTDGAGAYAYSYGIGRATGMLLFGAGFAFVIHLLCLRSARAFRVTFAVMLCLQLLGGVGVGMRASQSEKRAVYAEADRAERRVVDSSRAFLANDDPTDTSSFQALQDDLTVALDAYDKAAALDGGIEGECVRVATAYFRETFSLQGELDAAISRFFGEGVVDMTGLREEGVIGARIEQLASHVDAVERVRARWDDMPGALEKRFVSLGVNKKEAERAGRAFAGGPNQERNVRIWEIEREYWSLLLSQYELLEENPGSWEWSEIDQMALLDDAVFDAFHGISLRMERLGEEQRELQQQALAAAERLASGGER